MYQTAKALKEFFSGFDLPAYSTDSVPEDVELPYITYSLAEPECLYTGKIGGPVCRTVPEGSEI